MTVLRVIAILVALGGVLDPAVSLSRAIPTPVRLHVDRSDPDAADVEARLRAAMHDRLEFVAEGDADAHVVVGATRLDAAAFSKPVSLVTLQDEPGTAIVAAPSAVQVPVNSVESMAVTIRARGLSGQASTVVLEDGQVELARTEHRWSGTETATIHLPYLAVTAGARRLTIRVEPARGERRLFDNRVDVLAMARGARRPHCRDRAAAVVAGRLRPAPDRKRAGIPCCLDPSHGDRRRYACRRVPAWRHPRPVGAVRRRDRRCAGGATRRGSGRAAPVRGSERRHRCPVARPAPDRRLHRVVAGNDNRAAAD